MIDATSLELLSLVARTGSYSAAARALQMTQPGVTYQIRRLERSLGAPVTVRMGRSMQLTALGEMVLEFAQPALEELRAMERRIAAAVGEGVGLVRLVAFPSGNATIVATALAQLRQEHPQIEVRVATAEQPRAYEIVRSGEADLALTYRFGDGDDVPSPGQIDGLRHLDVMTEPISLLMPRDHPGAGRQLLDVAELPDARWLLGSQRFARLLQALYAPTGVDPQIQIVADDYVAMQSFAAAGLGLTLLPELAVRAHRHHALVARTLVGWPQRRLSIDFWPDQERVPAVRAVIEALRQAPKTLNLTSRSTRGSTGGGSAGNG
ncbi:MAG: LysR family transcriptional regulator [Allobranchiibius sp.]